MSTPIEVLFLQEKIHGKSSACHNCKQNQFIVSCYLFLHHNPRIKGIVSCSRKKIKSKQLGGTVSLEVIPVAFDCFLNQSPQFMWPWHNLSVITQRWMAPCCMNTTCALVGVTPSPYTSVTSCVIGAAWVTLKQKLHIALGQGSANTFSSCWGSS